MIFLFYGCLIAGAFVLVADVRGRLATSPQRVRTWRVLGLLAAAVAGLAPLLGWLTGSLGVQWPFPVVAIAYSTAFAVLAIGIVGWLGTRPSRYLRRLGYLGLLLLGAFPSFVLLLLAPLILLASASLVEPRQSATTT